MIDAEVQTEVLENNEDEEVLGWRFSKQRFYF